MMKSDGAPPPDENDTRGLEFEDLLSGYLDQLKDVGFIDPQEILAEHPGLGPAILQDLEAYVQLRSEKVTGSPLSTLGDYTIRRQIGRGGMGVVYEAWQSSLDRPVALKVLPAGIAADDKAFHRFMREAKTAAKLNHPHVVGVYGMGVESNTPYYAMELVEGETLAQVLLRLKDAGPETETPFGKRDSLVYFGKLAEAFADVADGLQHAHSKKVIHRDIKPSNLILDPKGRLRILDFGLARLEGQESLTASGEFVGTPLYMSPEQARRRKIPIDHRTDLYSLGATLYEMLTGRPPFRGKDNQDTLSQIIERDPEPVRKLNPRVARDLETIMLKCLRKEPEDRYGTAEALGQDLRRFARGEPVEARPQSGWERARKRLWRARWRMSVGLIIAAAIAVALWQLIALRGEARLRIEREYETRVLKGFLRLEIASLAQKSRAGETSLYLPSGVGGAARVSSGEPAALALKDLDGAAPLLPDKPDALYHRARALLYLGRDAEALQAIDGMLVRRPPFVPVWTLKAQILAARGDANGFEQTLSEAERIAAAPWEMTWVGLLRDWRSGDHAKLLAAYTALLEQSEGGREPFIGCMITARLGRGNAAIDAKDPAQALRDFTVAESLVPGAKEPSILAGKAWALLGHAEEAARIFEITFARAEEKDEAALAVSYVYEGLKRDEELEAWTKRIGNAALRERRLMSAYHNLGRWAEGIDAGRKALEFDPENPDIYDDLGFFLTQQDRYAESREVLEKALRKWPDSPRFLFRMAYNFHEWRKFEEAIPFFQKIAPSPQPLQSAALLFLGSSYLRTGRIEDGEAAFQSALMLDPSSPVIYRNAGLAFVKAGAIKEGLAYQERAIQLEPTSAYGHNNKGWALYFAGRLEESLASFRTAKGLYPWMPYPFLRSGIIFEAQGKKAEALAEFAAVLEGDSDSPEALALIQWAVRSWRDALPGEQIHRTVTALERSAEKATGNAAVLSTLAWALLASGSQPDQSRAASFALAGLAVPRASASSFATLASALREAIPGAPRESILAAVREVPSYAAIDFLATATSDSILIRDLRGRFAAAAGDEGAVRRLRYLEALVAAKAGRHAGAVDLLTRLAPEEREAPEPCLRLATELMASGDVAAAEQALRSFIEANPPRDRRPWDLWLRLGFVERQRTATDLLAEVPRALPAPETTASETEADCAGDARWLLESLARGEGIRIRCGGDEYQDPQGRVWGKDRFALGGEAEKPWVIGDREDIAGTHADPLFWTERNFGPEDAGERSGYAVPLPPGRYRVRLHCAEVRFKAKGLRRFDILIEEKKVLEDFDPAEAGIATASEQSFEAEVKDGLLEILFVRRVGDPKISAIEVETLN